MITTKPKTYEDEVRARMKAERTAAHHERLTGKAGGTPETLAKLKPNTVDVLRASDIIDDAQQSDLHRIARAVQMIAAPVAMRTAGRMFIDHGRSDSPLSEYDLQCLVWYQKWWDELVRQRQQMAWSIVYDVAVEGQSLREIQQARGMGRLRAKMLLIIGLDAYADVKRNRVDRSTAVTYHTS